MAWRFKILYKQSLRLEINLVFNDVIYHYTVKFTVFNTNSDNKNYNFEDDLTYKQSPQ